MLSKYKNAKDIIAASGRTNTFVNIVGLYAGTSGIYTVTDKESMPVSEVSTVDENC